MTVKECLKGMMRDRSLTQEGLAERVGKKQSNIAMYLLHSEGIRIDNLMMLANACDYRIELVDNGGSGKRYVIGDETVASAEQEPDVPGKQVSPTMQEMFSAFQEWYEQTHQGR